MAPQRRAAEQQHDQAAASGDGPTARTRGAAAAESAAQHEDEEEQQQRATAEMAWPLLLQHDSIRTQLPLVCMLLCCSKALAAAVAEHSAGQLDMPRFDTIEGAEQAAPWLRKHARLLRSLNLRWIECDSVLMPALVVAGPQTLALQSLGVTATTTTLPLLEQLPASCLTHLALQEVSVQPQDQPAFVARVSAALCRLTALRSLQLFRCMDEAAPPLSGLSALTQLTALRLVRPNSDVQHVPPQLLELKLFGGAEQQQQPLDLRHLAAATALTVVRTPVGEGDVLPPKLLRLWVETCRSVQPLLPLVQLQELRLRMEGQDDFTADQLRQLSRLTALSLQNSGVFQRREPASAGSWPLLPRLQRLELDDFFLSAPVCQHLAQLSSLTGLALREFELSEAGSAQQLAAALRQLSGLQQLELAHDFLTAGFNAATAEEFPEEAAAGTQQLVQAVGGLQQLRQLCIKYVPELAAAAGAKSSSLSALTALTALSLSSCRLTDAAVTAIVSQLPGLQSLDCSQNRQLTDAAMPAIGRLQQLSKLSLYDTAVADAGLQHLAGLGRLQQLDIRQTSVTAAGTCHLTGLTRAQEC